MSTAARQVHWSSDLPSLGRCSASQAKASVAGCSIGGTGRMPRARAVGHTEGIGGGRGGWRTSFAEATVSWRTLAISRWNLEQGGGQGHEEEHCSVLHSICHSLRCTISVTSCSSSLTIIHHPLFLATAHTLLTGRK